MPECEICSRPRAPRRAVIEGSVVDVCDFCVSLGEEIRQEIPQKTRVASDPYYFEEIVENYDAVVKQAREARGLTRAGLAAALKEKITIIERIENGRMTPDLELARKLEKVLGISLIGRASPEAVSFISSRENATVGDVVEIKK